MIAIDIEVFDIESCAVLVSRARRFLLGEVTSGHLSHVSVTRWNVVHVIFHVAERNYYVKLIDSRLIITTWTVGRDVIALSVSGKSERTSESSQ